MTRIIIKTEKKRKKAFSLEVAIARCSREAAVSWIDQECADNACCFSKHDQVVHSGIKTITLPITSVKRKHFNFFD